MNYPEELRERYNEVMYDERDIIQRFLEKQYDIRYGRQRDSWHFEPAVEIMNIYGNEIVVTDIRLDEGRFVVFNGMFGNLKDEYECSDFAYGELSKVIEALPDAEKIVKDNAVDDLKVMTTNLRIDYLLANAPFKYDLNGKLYTLDDVKCVNGEVSLIQALGNDTPASDMPTEVLVGLRDHINIEVLHRYDEYNKLVKFLSEQPNLCFEPADCGHVMFTIHGTDVKVDVLSASLDANGKLQLCVEDDNKEAIYLEEKNILPEYLVDLVGYIEDHFRCEIIDTYNSHNPELVRKINDAWKSEEYHDRFGDILFALGSRDKQEIQEKFDIVIDSNETAMDNAHEIMEGVCDDWDLETILSFIRYKE